MQELLQGLIEEIKRITEQLQQQNEQLTVLRKEIAEKDALILLMMKTLSQLIRYLLHLLLGLRRYKSIRFLHFLGRKMMILVPPSLRGSISNVPLHVISRRLRMFSRAIWGSLSFGCT